MENQDKKQTITIDRTRNEGQYVAALFTTTKEHENTGNLCEDILKSNEEYTEKFFQFGRGLEFEKKISRSEYESTGISQIISISGENISLSFGL